jgi:hypothetical protein
MKILAIDPGLNATGLAWTNPDGGVLVRTSRPAKRREIRDKVDNILQDLPTAPASGWDILIIEVPQIYTGVSMTGDPADLVRLSLLVGGLLCRIPHEGSMLVHPNTWKGQVPKNIHHKRIRARLPEIGRASKDALDAAGLWLYASDNQAARMFTARLK